MFTSKRYATKGIHEKVELHLQLLLWSLIDKRKRKGIIVDYLQVFELSIVRKDGVVIQRVIHRQECPSVIATYYLPMIDTPIKLTIWAMDSEAYCMMLLPEEY